MGVSIHGTMGGSSVDHFVPGSADPALLYEWSNYRLACRVMNSRKGVRRDVLDPFEVEHGWFALDLDEGAQIRAGDDLDPSVHAEVIATIARLRLHDDFCVRARSGFLNEWLAGHIDESFFRRKAPFVWHEARRQGFHPVSSASPADDPLK